MEKTKSSRHTGNARHCKVAAIILCASLAAALPPASALATQPGLLETMATRNVTALSEGTISSNTQARWALGTSGNLAIAGTGTVGADEGIYEICDQVEHIFIGKEITSIEPEAFCYFTQLKSVEFEEGSQLVAIGAYAFSGCSSLEYIDLPASVKTIGTAAFLDCAKLTWANFGSANSSLLAIDSSAFSNCKALGKIELPKSLRTIGDYAFSGCDGLESIVIPAKVESVGEGAFENCPHLDNVKVESPSTTRIDGYAFVGTTKAKMATTSVKKIKAGKKSLKIAWRKVPGANLYKLRYKQKATVKWKTAQTKKVSRTIKGLKRGKRYEVYIEAHEGGEAVCKSAVKTSPKVK